MMLKIKVLIIDEQPYFRAGVRQALSQEKNLEIMEAAPKDNIMDYIEKFLPDVVLLGSDLVQYKGLELGGRIARLFPHTRVIILSPNPNDEELFEVIRSSAVACISKTAQPGELVNVIHRASRGEYPINEALMTRPVVAKHVLNEFQEVSKFGEYVAIPLTQRERQILSYIADGNTNKQIAAILDISEQTIKNHVCAILRKMNANDRAHAVVLAIKKGWISLEDKK
jgi:DNA-binding NarL/FixJ family response regulator